MSNGPFLQESLSYPMFWLCLKLNVRLIGFLPPVCFLNPWETHERARLVKGRALG
jgi:hypothetical protein